MEIKININKKYFVLLIIAIVFAGAGVVVYGFGGNQPSVAGHSASEVDWTGFVFPAEIKAQLKGDTGLAGAQGLAGVAGATGAAGKGADVSLSGVLYGACYNHIASFIQRCDAVYPTFCIDSHCQCASGYKLITILKEQEYSSYACMKN